MKRPLLIALLTLMVALAATPAAATYSSLYIRWSDADMSNGVQYQAINYSFIQANNSVVSRTSYIASAEGWLETPPNVNLQIDAGARYLGWVFCTDLFNYADNPDEFAVDWYTENEDAASQADWLDPTADDGLRDVGGLNRAAYLANRFGPTATTHNQRVALNVAIWNAAYHSRFTYTGGLNGTQLGYYNTYMAAYGGWATQYEWFDNDDGGNYHQDFMNDVPEPTSLLLLGGVLVGAAALGWRKRRV